MPIYQYEAISSTGERIIEQGEFSSPVELYSTLRNQGYLLIDYKKRFFSNIPSIPKKIKRLELAELLRNLALVTRGGIPLVDALKDMVQSPGMTGLRKIIEKVIKRIEGGELFSEALSHYKTAFPNVVIILVRLGEETGRLDKTLEDAAIHLEKVQEIIDKTKRAISYPIFILLAMIGALAFWILYVLPKLFELFKSLGLKELPITTKILLATVEITKTYWPVFPVLIAIFIVLGFFSSRNEKLKFLWDNFWTHFPIIGRILKSSQLAFFFEYLSLLASSGIDIIRSLEIMEGAITHQVLRHGIRDIRATIVGGGNLSEAFKKCTLFEPFILRMVRAGENSGNMPEQLKILSDHYMEIVNRMVDSIAKKIEPILIGFAGMIFVIIALGLLGPIYDMMSNIK